MARSRRDFSKTSGFVLLFAITLLVGCNLEEGWPWSRNMFDFPSVEAQESAPYPPHGVRATVAVPPTSVTPFAGAWERIKEGKGRQEDEEAARVLFDRFCSACHGDQAKGADLNEDYLTPDLTEEDYASRTEEDIYTVIVEGGLSMPSYGEALPEPERWLVIHHLRTLQGKR
jgi:mono/diheme cytochrome c family protein